MFTIIIKFLFKKIFIRISPIKNFCLLSTLVSLHFKLARVVKLGGGTIGDELLTLIF